MDAGADEEHKDTEELVEELAEELVEESKEGKALRYDCGNG